MSGGPLWAQEGPSSAWPAIQTFRCPRTADQPTMKDAIHPVPFAAHESQQNGPAMHISSRTMFRISRISLAFMEGECLTTDLSDTSTHVQMAQLPDLPSPQSPNLDLIEDPFYTAELPSIMACLEPLPPSGMPVSPSSTPQPLFQVPSISLFLHMSRSAIAFRFLGGSILTAQYQVICGEAMASVSTSLHTLYVSLNGLLAC